MHIRATAGACCLCACLFAPPAGGAAIAQQATTVRGTVVAEETGEPIAGAHVWLSGGRPSTISDARGEFLLTPVLPGRRIVHAEYLGRRSTLVPVRVEAGGADVRIELTAAAIGVGGIVVSATREARSLAETPASIGVVGGAEIRAAKPSHPGEILDEIPGVWVNRTSGEGHMTAIRQPLSTNPVYLYVANGVPTRSTGFFNHNALYEINVPQADRIEVIKGPATALYGSDAIGGVISVSTRPAMADPGLDVSLEAGAHGWARLLASGALAGRSNGLRADLNVTRTDGWRDGTAYDRESLTLRWDQDRGDGASLTTILALSRIDQGTAGSSRLSAEDYRETPTLNYTPISYREVLAARLSSAYERVGRDWLVSVTPYARYNAMDMLPNWSLSYDPATSETSNASIGVLARVRREIDTWDASVIGGVDVDYSPGEHFERAVIPILDGGVFTDYDIGESLYDYDVAYTGVSPYVQLELSPLERLNVSAGLRLDHMGFDYDNRLGVLQSGAHRRPGSSSVWYTHLSPKLGATWQLGEQTSLFARWAHGFRVPSESQLFRQGAAEQTVGLEPVRADNLEAGIRGEFAGHVRYSIAGYRLNKTDNILDFRRADDTRITLNAGRTLHRGIEVGLGIMIDPSLQAEAAYSYARHTYEEWRPSPDIEYSGQEMEDAPHTLVSASLSWTPRALPAAGLSVEWTRVGGYYLNPENTERYEGHDLVGIRANLPVLDDVDLFARVHNMLDTRYAETAAYSAFRGRELAPGMGRTLYVGAAYRSGARP